MANLKSIELRGWKSIKEAQIDFGSLNVLIGANGSGKTNLISFFKLLHDVLREQLLKVVGLAGGANTLLHYGAKQTQQIDADLRFTADSREYGYKLQLSHAPPDSLVFTQQRVGIWQSGAETPEGWFDILTGGNKETLLARAERNGNKTTQWLRTLIDSCRVYHFHDTSSTAAVRQSAYVGDDGQLRSDAGNLPAILNRIWKQDSVAYRRIVNTVQQINPRFGDFVLRPDASNTNKLMLNWQEQGQEMVFGPHQLSDGTLRSIALVTLLLQPQHSLPELIIVDEPELGLHPYALAVIAGLLRMVSHNCQVIISTQSIELLNHFCVDDVIVVDRRGEATEFKRLKEGDLNEWLEDYSIGELWEKNVIGGGPH